MRPTLDPVHEFVLAQCKVLLDKVAPATLPLIWGRSTGIDRKLSLGDTKMATSLVNGLGGAAGFGVWEDAVERGLAPELHGVLFERFAGAMCGGRQCWRRRRGGGDSQRSTAGGERFQKFAAIHSGILYTAAERMI